MTTNCVEEPHQKTDSIDRALARSAVYGALSLALHAPAPETCERLLGGETADVLEQAASLLDSAWAQDRLGAVEDDPGPAHSGITPLVRAWVGAFPLQNRDRLAAAHGRLFGHTARGEACPYETEYGAEALFQQPRQLAEIQGFYAAFGLAPSREERERADHISCELEFLDFLSRKEAVALESGDSAMLDETRLAIRLFLKDHLGRFGPAFSYSLSNHDPGGFFGRAADLLSAFLALECRRLGIEAGPMLLRLRSAEDDGVPMACGQAPEAGLVQLETPE